MSSFSTRALIRTCVVALAIHATPALAQSRWAPGDVVASTATLADVRARHASPFDVAAPAYEERIETYHTVAKGTPFDSVATIRSGDFAISTNLDGDTYRVGRNGGRRWRRTPSGVVRIVASDVQGDDLDRWPVAILGFDAADCNVAGETRGVDPAYVLAYDPDGEVPHWLYVDQQTGEITREISRDGSRIVTFDFRDFRTIDGVRRPYAWHVDGAGGPADVTVAAIEEREVPRSLVAIPETTSTFSLRDDRIARLPTRFARSGTIFVAVTVDGHATEFVLDTGTTQMLIDGGAAHRFGLHEALDHTTVYELAAGPATARDVPFLTVGLGSGFGGIDGILGYEFFTGYVVHVDYAKQYVELIPHARFAPSPGAISIPISYAEGMPLAEGRIGPIAVTRLALDTGSPHVVLPSVRREAAQQSIDFTPTGFEKSERYLEGSITVRGGQISSLTIGGISFVDLAVRVERPTRDAMTIPLDGIIGTNALATLDLWFDYDDGRLYAKPF